MKETVSIEKKLTFPHFLIALLVLIVPFQLRFQFMLQSDQVVYHTSFYHIVHFHFPDLLLLTALVTVIFRYRVLLAEKVVWFLFAFLFFALFSFIWGRDIPLLLAACGWGELLLAASIFYLIASVQQEIDKETFFRLIFILILISGLIESVIGAMQFFSQKEVGFAWLGEPPLKVSKGIGGCINIHTAGRWCFDAIWPNVKCISRLLRTHGTFPHPNVLGGFLLVPMLAVYPLFLKEKGKKRWLYLLAFALFFFVLITTFSRAALFGFFLATLFFLILQKFPMRLFKFVLPLIIVCTLPFASQLKQRGGVVGATSISKHSNEERVLFQKIAWNMFLEHPVKGVGFQNFVARMDRHAPVGHKEYGRAPVHNIFMLVSSELGSIGLLFFLSFLGYVCWQGWKNRNSVWTAALLSLVVGLIFIGGCDHYLLTLQNGRFVFFLVLGLLYLSARETKEQIALLPAPETSRTHQ
jgi:hypothetical protein